MRRQLFGGGVAAYKQPADEGYAAVSTLRNFFPSCSYRDGVPGSGNAVKGRQAGSGNARQREIKGLSA